MTYHQFIKWHEDSHGLVTARVVFSDTYNDLFVDIADSIECNILIIDEIRKSIKSASGGIEVKEARFSINEAKISMEDKNSVIFMKSVQSVNIRIFFAVFIDTNDIPEASDILFQGLVRHEIEAEDLQWEGDHFDSGINPLRLLKFTVSTYDETVFNSFSLNDLINGNESKNIQGISEEWETANVKDRQGYFYSNESTDRIVKVDSIVNVNDLLRALADNLESAIFENGFGTINIAFDNSALPANWHPTRWLHDDRVYAWGGYVNRYVKLANNGTVCPYKTYKDDYVNLYLNPDGKPTIVEDSLGLPNDSATIDYYTKSPWMSYRRIKARPDEINEQQAKNFRFDKIKNFFELINRLAFELGMVAQIYWGESQTLRISFISRGSELGETIAIRSGTKGSVKMTSSEIKELTTKGMSFYYAHEGFAVYRVENGEIKHMYNADMDLQVDEIGNFENNVLFSLSPTVEHLLEGRDGSRTIKDVFFPHNHSFYHGTDRVINPPYPKATALHASMYLCVPNYTPHEDSAYSPDFYWGPAAEISMTSNGTEKSFATMASYLKFIYAFDINIQKFEYNIDLPWLYAGKSGGIISWKFIELYNKVLLDSTWWQIVEIKRQLPGVVTSIVLHSTSRFNFNNDFDSDMIEIPPLIGVNINEGSSASLLSLPIYEYVPGVLPFDLVSLKDDGTYERSIPLSDDHYHRIIGIAIINDDGVLTEVRDSGLIYSPDFPDEPINTQIHLRLAEPELNNWSTTHLEEKTLDESDVVIENLIVHIGTYVGYKTIEINTGFNSRFELL